MNEIKNVLNNYNQHIQFTIEEEKNQRISFLELLCIRKHHQSIKTDWYHKDTWSGRYLNFNSHLPFTYRRNTAASAEKILLLSEPEFHGKNFELLSRTLKNNFYPENLVENIIRRARKTVFSRLKDKTPMTQQSNVIYRVICSCGSKYIGQTKIR